MGYTDRINIRQGCISGGLSFINGAAIGCVGVSVIHGVDNEIWWDVESANSRNMHFDKVPAMELFSGRIATTKRLIEYLDAAVELNVPKGHTMHCLHYKEWREPKGFEYHAEAGTPAFGTERVEVITWNGKREARTVTPKRWVRVPGTVFGRFEVMDNFEFVEQENIRRGLWEPEPQK